MDTKSSKIILISLSIIYYSFLVPFSSSVLHPSSSILPPLSTVCRQSSRREEFGWNSMQLSPPKPVIINQSTTKKNKSLSDLFLISHQKPKEHTTRHLLASNLGWNQSVPLCHLLNPPSKNMFLRSVPVLSEHDFKMVLLAKSARSSWIMHGPYFSACTLMSINSFRSANYRADPNGLGFLIYTPQVMRCSFLFFSQKKMGLSGSQTSHFSGLFFTCHIFHEVAPSGLLKKNSGIIRWLRRWALTNLPAFFAKKNGTVVGTFDFMIHDTSLKEYII